MGLMKVKVTVSDLQHDNSFNGAWVHRYEFIADDSISELALARRVLSIADCKGARRLYGPIELAWKMPGVKIGIWADIESQPTEMLISEAPELITWEYSVFQQGQMVDKGYIRTWAHYEPADIIAYRQGVPALFKVTSREPSRKPNPLSLRKAPEYVSYASQSGRLAIHCWQASRKTLACPVLWTIRAPHKLNKNSIRYRFVCENKDMTTANVEYFALNWLGLEQPTIEKDTREVEASPEYLLNWKECDND